MYLPRTLVVSDHPFNSESLFALLSTFRSIDLVNRIGNYSYPRTEFKNNHIDVLLVDVYEDSSLEQIRTLFEQFERTRKLIITSSTNTWFLASLIHIGADGCFITTSKAGKLAEAISNIYHCKWYLPEELHNQLYCEIEYRNLSNNHQSTKLKNVDFEVSLDIDLLTNRENEILRLMAVGDSSSSIAKRLFISEATVYTHRKHILKKLGFHNTPSLIRCALEQGLI